MGKLIDMTGWIMKEHGISDSRLTVLSRAENTKDNRAQWVCQCECGKKCIVIGKNLRNGKTKSCGCLHDEKSKINMQKYNNQQIKISIGQRFGKLVVLEQTNKRKNNNIVWKCICDCGTISFVTSDCLSNKKTRSCGCLRKELCAKRIANWSISKPSNGEQKIIDILLRENINFTREQQFSDGEKIKYCRFDFYCKELNICIEFNGEQHYKYKQFFYKDKSEFLKAQERDRAKITFCLSNNIDLYCIPYWEINQINSFSDIIKEKYHAHSKFHNDTVWRLYQMG